MTLPPIFVSMVFLRSRVFQKPLGRRFMPQPLSLCQSQRPRPHRGKLQAHSRVVGKNRDLIPTGAADEPLHQQSAKLADLYPSLPPPVPGPHDGDLVVVGTLPFREDDDHVSPIESRVIQFPPQRQSAIGRSDRRDVWPPLPPPSLHTRVPG